MKVKTYRITTQWGEERIVRGTFKNICKRVNGQKCEIKRLTKKEERELNKED